MRLLKQQALAGDIVLLFAGESETLTHPYLARAWARRGADPGVEGPGQAQKIAMIGALDFVSRELIAETSCGKRSSYVMALLCPRNRQQAKAQRLAHKTSRNPYHLETTLHEELAAMNANQSCHPLANHRISA